MLKSTKYTEDFQIKAWATRYHVYEYIQKHGKLKALQVFPFSLVEYFEEWQTFNYKTNA